MGYIRCREHRCISTDEVLEDNLCVFELGNRFWHSIFTIIIIFATTIKYKCLIVAKINLQLNVTYFFCKIEKKK